MLAKLFNKLKMQSDMTSGNLYRKIILFAIPAMLTTMMQLLYVTIDLTTVHYGDSAESMGAIASNNALINLIVVVFTGVSLGANVLLSEAKGANNKEKAEKVLHTSYLSQTKQQGVPCCFVRLYIVAFIVRSRPVRIH